MDLFGKQPVFLQRADWRTLLVFSLDAFAGPAPLVAVSSDILDAEHPDRLLETGLFHRARIVGTAVYRSPAFGWLEAEKHAVLIRLGDAGALDPTSVKKTEASFSLPDGFLGGKGTAFIAEHGE